VGNVAVSTLAPVRASTTARVCVRAWVSAQMTYANVFATMVMIVVLLRGAVIDSWCRPGKVTSRQACDGPRPRKRSGKLLIKPSKWTGPAPAPHPTGQILGKASRQSGSQAIHESRSRRSTGTNPASQPQVGQSKTYIRFNVTADLDRVRVPAGGRIVAEHVRVWARGLAIIDPVHVETAARLRKHFQQPRPVRLPDDLTRELGDYDRAFGLTGEAI
jgi:hypothetical protein